MDIWYLVENQNRAIITLQQPTSTQTRRCNLLHLLALALRCNVLHLLDLAFAALHLQHRSTALRVDKSCTPALLTRKKSSSMDASAQRNRMTKAPQQVLFPSQRWPLSRKTCTKRTHKPPALLPPIHSHALQATAAAVFARSCKHFLIWWRRLSSGSVLSNTILMLPKNILRNMVRIWIQT